MPALMRSLISLASHFVAEVRNDFETGLLNANTSECKTYLTKKASLTTPIDEK